MRKRLLYPLLFLSLAACATESTADDSAAGGDEQEVTGTAVASKKAFFAGDFYYARIANGEFSLWKSDEASDQHCPDGDLEGGKLVFKTKKFSVENSGNFTANTPKSSWK